MRFQGDLALQAPPISAKEAMTGKALSSTDWMSSSDLGLQVADLQHSHLKAGCAMSTTVFMGGKVLSSTGWMSGSDLGLQVADLQRSHLKAGCAMSTTVFMGGKALSSTGWMSGSDLGLQGSQKSHNNRIWPTCTLQNTINEVPE
ncbi:hypothetical protein EDD22DRAFT_849367 [Suillus occidentalis]|nr:hypothetical protein EDD22DRAFT_849367 [Suillus occidentalis]